MPVVTTTVLTLFANVLRKLWPFEVDQNFINIDTALQGKVLHSHLQSIRCLLERLLMRLIWEARPLNSVPAGGGLMSS